MATLNGLDRGLHALQYVSTQPQGVSVADLAAHLGVDRAIAYRVVATLEEHALVARIDKRVHLGAGIVPLAGRFQPHLIHAAEPVLRALAESTDAPAFLTVQQGPDECVAVLGVEPRVHQSPVQVGYRIGMHHHLTRGANGIAILALHPRADDDSPGVVSAREQGYSVTSGHLQQGATGIAAGFMAPGSLGASVGVVAMGELDVQRVADRVRTAANELIALLGAWSSEVDSMVGMRGSPPPE